MRSVGNPVRLGRDVLVSSAEGERSLNFKAPSRDKSKPAPHEIHLCFPRESLNLRFFIYKSRSNVYTLPKPTVLRVKCPTNC